MGFVGSNLGPGDGRGVDLVGGVNLRFGFSLYGGTPGMPNCGLSGSLLSSSPVCGLPRFMKNENGWGGFASRGASIGTQPTPVILFSSVFAGHASTLITTQEGQTVE